MDLLIDLNLKIIMIRYLIILMVLINSCAFSKLKKKEPTTDIFTYTGRFDLSDPQKPQFAHSGNQIVFQFKGDELRIGLSHKSNEDAGNKNFFCVIINNKVTQVLESTLDVKYHEIEINSPDSFVNIEVFKRTEASCGIAVFHGVEYEIGELKKSPIIKRSIEWIGDSFLVGYGNLVSIEPPPEGNPSTGFHAVNENGYLGFGAIATRALKANYSCVGMSGRGVYRNFDTSEEWTIPKVYPFLFPKDESLKKYDFSYKQDLIVVKIGTNDFGPEIRSHYNLADSGRFVSTYLEFLKFVTEQNPNSKIVLAMGGGITDYFPVGSKRLSRFRSWVKTIKIEAQKKYLNTFGFFEFNLQESPYGEDWHPTVKSQEKFANEITPFLREFMNW